MPRPSNRPAYDLSFGYNSTERQIIVAEDENGNLLFKRGLIQELVDQQRTDTFSYQHRDPRVDLPAAFESFRYGAGFDYAVDDGDLGFAGYSYTIGVDCSDGDVAVLGPATTAAFSGSTPIKGFCQSSLGLFFWDTRYVYRWGGTSNLVGTQVYDAGAGGVVNDVIEFTNGDATFVLAGLRGVGYAYTTDGTTWVLSEAAQSAGAHRASANTNANSTTITLGEPAGAASNDILIATLVTNNTSDYMVPANLSDWNLVARQLVGTTSGYMTVYWCRRGGSAPSLVFNTSAGGSVQIEAGMSAYQSCITVGSPIDVISQKSNSSATSHTLTAITTTGSNRRLVGMVGISTSEAITPPGSGTERYDSTAGGTVSVEAFDLTQAAAGSSGALTATTAGSSNSATVLLALKPVAHTGAADVSRWAIRGSTTGAPLLWALDSRCNIRSASDPTSTASWSTADALQIGESRRTILGLVVLDNVFYLFTDKGITSYDGTTVKTVFTSPLSAPPSVVARPIVGPDRGVYFTFGSSILKFDTEALTVDTIWPRGQQKNHSVIGGDITAIEASERHLYFMATGYGGANHYLMKLDPFFSVELGGNTIFPVHTIASRAASTCAAIAFLKASSLHISTTNPALMYGNTNNLVYSVLARPGIRPQNDSEYRFDTNANRALAGSFITFRAQGFPKWLTRGDLDGKTTTTETLRLAYQLPAGSETNIVTANTAQTGRTTATLSPVEITTVRPWVYMNTSGNTLTPVLNGLVLHAAPNAPRDAGFSFVASLIDEQETRHGGKDRYQAAEVENYLFNSINQIATIKDLRGSSWTVKVLDVEMVGAKYGPDKKLETLVKVTAAQLTS